MKKIVVLLFPIICNSQNNQFKKEEIALNFFKEKIINVEYGKNKRFYFNGKLENESSSTVMFCKDIDKSEIKDSKNEYDYIDVKDKIFRKENFFDSFLISNKKKIKVYVFRKCYFKDSTIVVIYVAHEKIDNYYVIQLNSSGDVIDYCKEIYYE